MVHSARAKKVASPRHIAVRRREVIWIFGGTEKIQMTAAWDSGTTAVSAEKSALACGIAVLMAFKPRASASNNKYNLSIPTKGNLEH